MARFRVRNKANNGWLDCSTTPMYVRNEDNTDWVPLMVDKFSVRNLWGKRWHDISDEYDPSYDDPCLNMDTGACGGGPTSLTRGSGNGTGSGGADYDQLDGYPPGYDLPDAGRTGFELINNFLPPTGRGIRRPGIKTVESYDPSGVASRSGLGTYANPNVPYASVHGRGAVITETVFAMPSTEGFVELLFASYASGGMSVDVYHMGDRVASTCGKVGGRGRIKFQFDPDATDMRIMVRVRTDQGGHWSLMCYPPRLSATTDRGNLALDFQAAYDVINYPDVIHPDYIGTPLFPAPCHAAVWPIASRIQDATAFEYYHFIGTVAGWMYLDFTSWETFDFVEVYQSGRRIATTLDAQTSLGYLFFYYDPRGSQSYDLMIRVVAKDFGSAASLSSNYYSIYCPSERGAREYRHPCQSYSVYSAGHPTTEDNFELGTQSDTRAMLIQLQAGSFDTKFEVFDNAMNLLDTSIIAGGTTGTLEFWKLPSQPLRSNITVRVTSAIGCDWNYLVYCPIQPVQFSIPDYTAPYRCVTIAGGGAQPPEADAFPWGPYAVNQTGGRNVGADVGTILTQGDGYKVLWGGTNGWICFNNDFVRPITSITLQWKYDGRNGTWHDINIYERFAGAGTAQHTVSYSAMQTFTLPANVPAGEEIWINWSGSGDQGDGNNLDFISITGVTFG